MNKEAAANCIKCNRICLIHPTYEDGLYVVTPLQCGHILKKEYSQTYWNMKRKEEFYKTFWNES